MWAGIQYIMQLNILKFIFASVLRMKWNEMLYNVLKRQYWADNGRTELSLRDEVT